MATLVIRGNSDTYTIIEALPAGRNRRTYRAFAKKRKKEVLLKVPNLDDATDKADELEKQNEALRREREALRLLARVTGIAHFLWEDQLLSEDDRFESEDHLERHECNVYEFS
jgi:hypothetical protein